MRLCIQADLLRSRRVYDGKTHRIARVPFDIYEKRTAWRCQMLNKKATPRRSDEPKYS